VKRNNCDVVFTLRFSTSVVLLPSNFILDCSLVFFVFPQSFIICHWCTFNGCVLQRKVLEIQPAFIWRDWEKPRVTLQRSVLAEILYTKQESWRLCGWWLCVSPQTPANSLKITVVHSNISFVCLFVFGPTVPTGLGPPHSRGFYITHDVAPHSVGLSGRVISSSQRPLHDNRQHSQQTNIHAPGGIRTHNLSRRAAADLRRRPRGHWDRLTTGLRNRKRFESTITVVMLYCNLVFKLSPCSKCNLFLFG